ncbi:MAG: MerR family transcriptional regulator [Proteobacteria bacterium]|nr:MerR family transcriptional regulator [Pseudomonadota bacterium]
MLPAGGFPNSSAKKLAHRGRRIYEEEGLIRPARKSVSNQRMYSEQDLIWIRCISELIHGHSLTTVGIRRLLDLIPCWEVKHCPDDVFARCAPNVNIPGMAVRPPVRATAQPPAHEREKDPSAADAVEIKIFYGLKEFGVVFPCLKCIQAERIARRLRQGAIGKPAGAASRTASARGERGLIGKG